MIKSHLTKKRSGEEATPSPGFFTSSGKKSRVLVEEKYLNRVYREMLVDDIKKDLGEDYTDQDAENVLQMVIAEHKRDGTYQKILDAYLKEKIRRVQEKAGIIPKTGETATPRAKA